MFKKRIFVSGGCGFLGNHLVRHLVKNKKDWQIINYDALTYAGIKENLADIEGEENYVFVNGDIRDIPGLENVFDKYQITDIIHLAAESHVDNSIRSPRPFIESNIVGTFNLLDVAKIKWTGRDGLKGHKFYYFSTDEVFGFLDSEGEPFKETTPINPSSPYSVSKACGDLLVKAYHKTYGLETIISHCCNIIGGSQMIEKLVPATIQRILNNEPIIVYDKGLQVREWIYTDDIVSAAMTVFEKGVPGEAYNIGSGNECKNIDMVLMIIELVCSKMKWSSEKYKKILDSIKYVGNARPGHDFRYAINHSKITKKLGWKPKVSLEEGLEKTVNWYIDNQDWVNKLRNRNDDLGILDNNTFSTKIS